MARCDNPDCKVSTTISDELSFGSGSLDEWGFWQLPCEQCARMHELDYPEDGRCWPPPGMKHGFVSDAEGYCESCFQPIGSSPGCSSCEDYLYFERQGEVLKLHKVSHAGYFASPADVQEEEPSCRLPPLYDENEARKAKRRKRLEKNKRTSRKSSAHVRVRASILDISGSATEAYPFGNEDGKEGLTLNVKVRMGGLVMHLDVRKTGRKSLARIARELHRVKNLSFPVYTSALFNGFGNIEVDSHEIRVRKHSMGMFPWSRVSRTSKKYKRI